MNTRSDYDETRYVVNSGGQRVKPIELYGSPTPNVLKITIMLEEVGLPYETRQVNVWKGEQFTEEFVKLNPNSKVPVIVDHEPAGDPYPVFESGAILLYLAEKTGRLLPGQGRARYDVIQWLAFQMAGLGPMTGQFNHFMMFAGGGHEYSASRYTTEVARLYRVIDRRLTEASYLGGDAYSIADIAAYAWIAHQARRFGRTLQFMDASSQEHPALARWFGEVSARPGVVRGEAAFAALPSQLGMATPDDLDRVFGRGRYAMPSPLSNEPAKPRSPASPGDVAS
jgi:GST-like protein